MKVVLDTNIIVSGLMVVPSLPASILDLWLAKRFTLLSCEEQIGEIREVTGRPRIRPRIHRRMAGKIVNRMRDTGILKVDLPEIEVSPDPWDNYLLALARVGDADFLVTGDKADLLALGKFGRTGIVTARRFLESL